MTLAIEIQGLRKIYGNGFEALKGVDLKVAEGDFYALLGPNGAGKSTTIGVLSSLVRKTGGKVTICGHDIDTAFSQAKQYVGIVPQEFNFGVFEKIKDILINQAGYFGVPRKLAIERADHYLKKLGLREKRNEQARNLSGGMKRRLMIARALVHEPKVLILDEPTAGVDIELRRSMWDFLREINAAGTTIVLTTHYLEEAESLCRNVAIINEGEIVEDTSVKSLLKQLNKEIFVLDCQDTIAQCPEVAGYRLVQIDDSSLEVEIEKGQSLNAVFNALNNAAIEVVSMRNKVNRLEELFVSLVNQDNKRAEANAHAS